MKKNFSVLAIVKQLKSDDAKKPKKVFNGQVNFFLKPLSQLKKNSISGFEIDPLIRVGTSDKGEPYWEECEPHEAEMWSVFASLKGEGRECIADCNDESTANKLAKLLELVVAKFEKMERTLTSVNEFYELEIEQVPINRIRPTLYKIAYKKGGEIKKLRKPVSIEVWYTGIPTKEDIEHTITLNDRSRWNTSLKKGAPVEISERIFWEMFDSSVINAYDSTTQYFELCKPHHYENKEPVHRAFWMWKGEYFTGHPRSFPRYKIIIKKKEDNIN